VARRRLGRWLALICLPLALTTVALLGFGGSGSAGATAGQLSSIKPVTYPLPNTATPLSATMVAVARHGRN
jgi:hypothetical protein